MTRLLICDTAADGAAALRGLCARMPLVAVVGEAGDRATCASLAQELAPDVVLLGESLARLDRRRVMANLREQAPSARIVAVVDEADVETAGTTVVVRGAPLWQLEHALTEGDESLLRLEHTLRVGLRTFGPQLVCRQLGTQLAAEFVALYFRARDRTLSLAGLAGIAGPDYLSPAPAAVERAVRSGRREPLTAEERAELQSVGAWRAAAAVPLVAGDRSLGALLIAAPARSKRSIDWALGDRAAEVAARVLAEHLQLPRALRHADRDPLTGLLNRRAFDAALSQAVDNAGASGNLHSLIVVGPDPCKPASGPERGDEQPLRLVARLLGQCLAADDQLFRIDDSHVGAIVGGGENEARAIVARLAAAGRRRPRLRRLAAGVAILSAGASAEQLLADARASLDGETCSARDRRRPAERPGDPSC